MLVELTVRQLSRLTDVREEAGVRACLVAVRNDKHGVVGVEPQHDIFRQSPIAASRLGFLQNVVQRSVGMVLVGEAEGRAIGTGERCLSVLASHQRTNLVAIDGVILSIDAFVVLGRRLVQVELHTFKRIAVLVYLLDAVHEGRLEVEAHLQTGIVVAALQIKHLQAVLGAGGEDLVPLIVGGPMHRIGLGLSKSCYVHVVQRGLLVVRKAAGVVGQSAGAPALAGDDLAGAEIDGTVQLAVNAAQIQHQHVVYEDPDIIVTGELEHHRLLAVGAHVQLAVFRLGKIHLHGHAHVMVCMNLIVNVRDVLGAGKDVGLVPALVGGLDAVEHFLRRVEREEITQAHVAIEILSSFVPTGIRAPHGRAVVEREGTVALRAVLRRGAALLKFREVFPGVVVIVAILIYLEQTGDILIGFFTIRCCIRIKQIAQRCLLAGTADVPIGGHRQATALKELLGEGAGSIDTGILILRMVEVRNVHELAGAPVVCLRVRRVLQLAARIVQVDVRVPLAQRGLHNALHVHVGLAPRTTGARALVPKAGFAHGRAAEEQQCVFIDAVAVILEFRASRQDVVITRYAEVIVKQVDCGACRCDAMHLMASPEAAIVYLFMRQERTISRVCYGVGLRPAEENRDRRCRHALRQGVAVDGGLRLIGISSIAERRSYLLREYAPSPVPQDRNGGFLAVCEGDVHVLGQKGFHIVLVNVFRIFDEQRKVPRSVGFNEDAVLVVPRPIRDVGIGRLSIGLRVGCLTCRFRSRRIGSLVGRCAYRAHA